ncbi:helix-hairpin-helix domain-containing protein [Streptomyces sp. NPDC047017]|uniref:helix-hairpin-helix domain-containing protein n=1 Tax=Streptomyces sp. NPDC047017 TaxID=3155024 RepID=UPI00340FC6D0
MALRAHPRTPRATSGPGRAPDSDGRTRRRPHRHHPRPPASHPPHRRHAPAEELRRRARVLFAEHPGRPGESGSAPPRAAGRPAAPPRYDARRGAAEARTGRTEEAGAERTERGEAATPDEADVTTAASAVDVDTGEKAPEAEKPPGAASPWRERTGLALRERLPLWLQTRCGLERRSVIALTVVLAVAVVLAAQHFWTGRTRSVPAPEVVRAVATHPGPAEARGAPSAVPAAPPGAGTPTAGPEIVVDVGGKVREPGVHRLPAGSRVADALRAAGGVRPGTDLDGLNRARLLVDGEQVVVGAPAPAAPAGPAAGPGKASAPASPVSLNSATADQLETLPGVGPVLAQHIVDYRTQHGGFRSVDQLREVNGIGDRRYADLRPLVRP